MADVKLVKSIYTEGDVTSLGELAAADNAKIPGTLEITGGTTVGTLAGIVKAAAGVLSATALGAADLKFFMNAAGTAPEWHAGAKVLVSDRDTAAVGAPTDVSYTTVGFKPSVIIVIACIDDTVVASWGFCSAAGGSGRICTNREGVANAYQYGTDLCALYIGAGAHQKAVIKSYDADGFTLTWTKTGSPTGTAVLFFLCFR